MLARMKKLLRRGEVCPYCFETYRLRETPFRCTTPRCSRDIDEVRSRVWDDSLPLGKVLPPVGPRAGEVRCSECSQVSRKRLCPHCHMELPYTVGRFQNLIFAVIGAKETGKSHYIAVLIHELQNRLGPQLDLLVEPVDDATIQRYREDFYEPLFQQKRVIEVTRSAMDNRRVQMPLVYSLTFGGRDLFGRRKIVGAVTLVFFDTAGEDLQDEDTMQRVNKYIYRSDGILLLLDPLQLPRVRDQLSDRTALPEKTTETSEIISRVSKLIVTGRKLPPKAPIGVPLAVAFSKFDAVGELVDPQLQLNAESRHDDGFDTADFEAVDAEMRSLLSHWDSERIEHQVETRFERHGFFGLTALGCNPHGDRRVPRVLPRRVEDPFLWLLHQHGLVGRAGQRAKAAAGTVDRRWALAGLAGLLAVALVFAVWSFAFRGASSPPRPMLPGVAEQAPPVLRPIASVSLVLTPLSEASVGLPRLSRAAVRPVRTETTGRGRSEVRGLVFELALEPPLGRRTPLTGALLLRIFGPDGRLLPGEGDHPDFSFHRSLRLEEPLTLTADYGGPQSEALQPGVHRVEFRWGGRPLYEAEFKVEEA